MKKSYGYTVWKALQEYAVWQPGDHTELGDYGVIREGCFRRIGNIKEYLSRIDIHTKKNLLEHISLRSDSSTELKPVASDRVTLSFKFAKTNGVLLSAKDVEVNTVLDLQSLGKLISEIAEWDRSWHVVTSVRNAGRFVLVISWDPDLAVEGSVKEVEEFMKGCPASGSQVKLTGKINLKMIGENGPVSVRLHQLKRSGKSFRHLGDNPAGKDTWVFAPCLDPVKES